MKTKQFIFGYGSLMNSKSRKKTIRSSRRVVRARLKGYQRKFNMPVYGHLYLNIVPRKGMSVEGVCIPISRKEFGMLRARERGYSCVNVSENMSPKISGEIYAFIGPDRTYPRLTILQSYIDTCLSAIPKARRNTWMSDTVIQNIVEDDRKNPRYANAPKK